MSFGRYYAEYAICNECKSMSPAGNPQEIDRWAQEHQASHVILDVQERAKKAGHELTVSVLWRDMDCGEERVVCSCGWVGKVTRVASVNDEEATKHIEQHVLCDHQWSNCLQMTNPPRKTCLKCGLTIPVENGKIS